MGRMQIPDAQVVDLRGPVSYREWPGPKARTFVLSHGLGGAHVNWAQVAPGLAERGRVLVPDLAGFGDTPLAGRSATLTANRELLSAFLEKLVGGSAVLIGNSMGGAISMLQAALEPASVEALVLSSSVFPWAKGARPAAIVMVGFALYRTPGVGRWLATRRFRHMDPEQAVRIGFRIITADPRAIPTDVVLAHAELLRQRQRDLEAEEAFLQATRSLLSLGRRPEVSRRILDGIASPVLVIHGRRDRLVPIEFAEAAVEERPKWRLREFPDLGHVPQLEAPVRWLAAVTGWLDELDAA